MKWAIGLNKTGGIIYYPQYISGKEGDIALTIVFAKCLLFAYARNKRTRLGRRVAKFS